MAFANIHLVLRDDADPAVRSYLRWDEEADGPYSGPVTNRAGRIFKFLADEKVVSNLWKVPTIGGRQYRLYSISFSDDQYSLSQIRDELDWLVTEYGAQVFIVGAWEFTGEQYGTEHVYDTRLVDRWVTQRNPDYDPNEFLEDEVTPNPAYDPEQYIRVFVTGIEETYVSGMTGTPIYPIHAQYDKFMPDDADGNPDPTLRDVNLLAGQAPRSFF